MKHEYKYFSTILNKPFDTVDELVKAEEADKKQKAEEQAKLEKSVAEKQQKEKELQATKKQMAKAVEDATKEVNEANDLYDVAQSRAKEIMSEASKKANDLIDEAAKKVRLAEEKRYKAVAEFNKQFGTYTTTVTGDMAAKMYNKALKRIEDFWESFWKF